MLLHLIWPGHPPFYTRMHRLEFHKLTERVTRNLFERCTFKFLLSCDVEEKYQKLTPVDCSDSLRKPTLETESYIPFGHKML